MDKEHALEIWERLFPGKEVAYDFASHPMKKEDFRNENSHYGWDIDEKKPFLNREDNFFPCSLNTMGFRQRKPSFKVGNHIFEVRKGRAYGTFAIYDITDRNNPVNMEPNEENQDPSFNRARFHEIAVSQHHQDSRFMIPTPSSIIKNVFQQRLDESDVALENTISQDDICEDEEDAVILPTEEKKEENNGFEEKAEENIENEDDQMKEENPSEENDQSEDISASKDDDREETEDSSEENQVPEIIEDDEEETIVEGNPEETQEEKFTEEEKPSDVNEDSMVEQLKKQLDENLAEISSLNMQVSTLAAEKEDLEQKNLSLVDENETVKKNADKTLLESRTQVESMTDRLNAILALSDTLKSKINEQQDEITKKKSEIENLTLEKEKLEGELSLAKDSNVSLSEELNGYSSKVVLSKEEYDSLTENAASLDAQLENLKNENASLNSVIESLKEESEKISQEKEELENSSSSLNREKEETSSRLEGVLQEKNALSSELEGKKKENEALMQQIQSLNSSIGSLHDQISLLNSSLSSLQDEKNQLDSEKAGLTKRLEEETKKNGTLSLQLEEAKKNYDSLDAQGELTSDQLAALEEENETLKASLEEEKSFTNEAQERLDAADERLKALLAERDENEKNLNKQILDEQAKNDLLKTEKDQLDSKINALNEKVVSLQSEIERKDNDYLEKKNALELDNKNKDETLLLVQKERDEEIRKNLYLSLDGKMEHYDELLSYLNENGLPFNEEEIQKFFLLHKDYKKKALEHYEEVNSEIVASSVEEVPYHREEREREEKALNYYDQIFSTEKNKVSDFAGRYIVLNDYQNKDSEYSWDYILLDPNLPETLDNILIANEKSLKDYRPDEAFFTNGHRFETIVIDSKKKIVSADYISDPYDFSEAIRITRNNQEKISPLIYLFIKIVGINSASPDEKSLMEFFDLMDRTVKRCCPLSFIEMKTVVGINKGNYAFITFDGGINDAYRETLDYALLLNSYRREYKLQNKLNAVIVLNEVDVPFSKRHLDYDALLTQTRDDELRALRYEFNMAVINSTIKRTLHIGPKIIDKLPLDQNLLKPSQIGTGNFAKMYRFDKEFKVYNFVYSLSHREEKTEE